MANEEDSEVWYIFAERIVLGVGDILQRSVLVHH